jgi:hypothetical protein
LEFDIKARQIKTIPTNGRLDLPLRICGFYVTRRHKRSRDAEKAGFALFF